MSDRESSAHDKAFRDAIAYARRMLQPRVEQAGAWPMLAAAAFFAVCAMTFATAAVMAPPAQLTPPAVRGAL